MKKQFVLNSFLFKLLGLPFDESANCVFSVKIDPNSDYANLIEQYGYVPTSLYIPYSILYEKYPRYAFIFVS